MGECGLWRATRLVTHRIRVPGLGRGSTEETWLATTNNQPTNNNNMGFRETRSRGGHTLRRVTNAWLSTPCPWLSSAGNTNRRPCWANGLLPELRQLEVECRDCAL